MKLAEQIVESLLSEWGSSSDFRNYRPLVAKRAGPANCQPGHTVKVGEIGRAHV